MCGSRAPPVQGRGGDCFLRAPGLLGALVAPAQGRPHGRVLPRPDGMVTPAIPCAEARAVSGGKGRSRIVVVTAGMAANMVAVRCPGSALPPANVFVIRQGWREAMGVRRPTPMVVAVWDGRRAIQCRRRACRGAYAFPPAKAFLLGGAGGESSLFAALPPCGLYCGVDGAPFNTGGAHAGVPAPSPWPESLSLDGVGEKSFPAP